MLFNSFQFILFFPIVIFVYFLTKHKWRWLWLLGASYYFYMCWKPEYLVLIIFSTLIDYYLAIKISESAHKKRRKLLLILSLTVNLGVLFTFKYFNFFSDSIVAILSNFNIFYESSFFDLLLPVGISFYTFQTLSYTIDVYRGDVKPEKHLGIFALYVSFWPQLVAGPIERSSHLMPQFRKKMEFDYQRVVEGFRLILWGFFKKIVIADRLAIYVNEVYNSPTAYQGLPIIIATFFFAFQIYCDFSGYTDIAIGSAKVMGFDLMENFKRPYFSKSIKEFWQRWHISLSTWFKDYLYIPLGGNKVLKWRWYYNLFITFLVSGLWHGANWTFVIWGALHGFYLIIEIQLTSFIKFYNKKPNLLKKIFNILFIFTLVVLSWGIFRANNVADIPILLKGAFHIFPIHYNVLKGGVFLSNIELLLSFSLILFLVFVELIERKERIYIIVGKMHIIKRWTLYICVILFIIFFGYYGEEENFIYFQF